LNLEANEILDPELVPLEAIEGPPVRDARVAGASLGACFAGRLVLTIGFSLGESSARAANLLEVLRVGPVLDLFPPGQKEAVFEGAGACSFKKAGTYFLDILELVIIIVAMGLSLSRFCVQIFSGRSEK